MTKRWTIAGIAAVAALIVALDNAWDVVARAAPWAEESRVAAIEAQVAGLDARGLTWQVDSLSNQLYAARAACRAGDRAACDHASDLQRQLAEALAALKVLRGF